MSMIIAKLMFNECVHVCWRINVKHQQNHTVPSLYPHTKHSHINPLYSSCYPQSIDRILRGAPRPPLLQLELLKHQFNTSNTTRISILLHIARWNSCLSILVMVIMHYGQIESHMVVDVSLDGLLLGFLRKV